MSNTSLSESSSPPQVSICCLTYNHVNFVERTIMSFLSQECDFDYEIIIGDDCSADGTIKKLEKFEKQYENVRVIFHKERVGAGSNWLEAIASCRGKYISYCDGDDYFVTTTRLQVFYEYMENNSNCSLVFGPAIRCYEDGTTAIRNNYKSSEINKINLNWVLKKGGGFYPTSSSFFRSRLMKNLPVWFNEHSTGDYPLAILAIINGSIGYIDEITVAYTVHSQSMTNRIIDNKDDCQSIVLNKCKQNIIFIDLLCAEVAISKKIRKYLISKEEYIFYAKKHLCGYRISPYFGIFKIKYGFYFRVRLLVRLLWCSCRKFW